MVHSGPRGSFAERVTLRPVSELHGRFRFDEVDGAVGFVELTGDGALEGLKLREAVYLDIETTGLGGGAGTWPFMVALGRFKGDELELWQGFMRSPAEEAGVLEETARRIADSSGVVSFFGKSFDRHRLEDKMRVHGIEAPFGRLPHLDLYHPLNRLYTRRAGWDRVGGGGESPAGSGFGDGRLATMERALCGLERGLDLSGAHAPAAWFDYLAGRPHLLEEVFRHNALDVWSLVTLAAHLGRTLCEVRVDGSPLEGPRLARQLGLASLAKARADRHGELAALDRALEELGPREVPCALALWVADARRLAGDPVGALGAYEALEERADLPPRLRAASAQERAKLLEHHAKNPGAALAAAEAARASAVQGRLGARFLDELDRRAERLQKKLRASQ